MQINTRKTRQLGEQSRGINKARFYEVNLMRETFVSQGNLHVEIINLSALLGEFVYANFSCNPSILGISFQLKPRRVFGELILSFVLRELKPSELFLSLLLRKFAVSDLTLSICSMIRCLTTVTSFENLSTHIFNKSQVMMKKTNRRGD